ncbi:MAG: MarR family transcriptional regulator, partial [Myxococcota bacterium]
RFDVMAALERAGPMRMSALSGALRVSAGNVTGIVDALEREGLALRRPVPGDRRAMEVALTEAGRARFEAVARLHELWVDELLSDIGADGLALLRDRLGRTAKRLEGA